MSSGMLSPSSGQASSTNGNTASTCGTTKEARPLGARGEGSTQVIPPQEKGATAMVGVVQTSRIPTDRAVLEEAKASICTGDTAWTLLVGGGGG